MPTSATAGKKAKISYGTNGVDYTNITEVIDLDGPGRTTPQIDVTNRDSTNEYYESVGGPHSGGECIITCNYVQSDSTQSDLIDKHDDQTLLYFKIEWNDSSAAETTFTGRISAAPVSSPFQAQQTITFTITINGKPTMST